MRILFDPWLMNLDVRTTVGDEARCKCPYHSPDRRPSASFNMRTGLFHCYACGASHNAEQVARKTGGVAMKMPAFKHVHFNEKEDWSWLLQMPLAYDNEYLDGRGITNDEVLKYGIVDTGAGVAFPIHDSRGKVTGFQERRYVGDPRYLFHGQRMPIWHMHLRDRLGKSPYIVEGIFGVINAERYGIKAVTSMSASAITDVGPVLGGMKPMVLFDDDLPGYIAAAKATLAFGYRVVFPGAEADELSGGEWHNLLSFHTVTARIGQLREVCGDTKRFDEEIARFIKKRRINGRTGQVRTAYSANASNFSQQKRGIFA